MNETKIVRKYFTCSIHTECEDWLYDMCDKYSAHIMHKNTPQKGVYDRVIKGSVAFLYGKDGFVAYGLVSETDTDFNCTELGDWQYLVKVEKWHWYDETNHKKSVSSYGIGYNLPYGGSVHGTIKQIAESFALQKMKEIDPNSDLYKQVLSNIESSNKTKKMIEIIKQKKQVVLQGAPGTGKTYATAALAVGLCNEEIDTTKRTEVMEEYKKLVKAKRIAFTTFHQSMDYEEFVEGIKPETIDNEVTYKVRSGIFKEICDNALSAQKDHSDDNFEEVWNNLIKYLSEKDYIDIPLLTGSSTIRVELNTTGDGLVNRTYPDENCTKGDWINGKSKFFNKEQLYNVYRGLPGIPSGGHDNYRKAIIKFLTINYNLKDYKDSGFVNEPQKYVLIIDEINRANISKVLGELITLLEADKRIGAENEVTVTLPYSQKEFGVPKNLYIIGTMNTADRSVGYIDYAIRRRFAFITLKSKRNVIEQYNSATKDLALTYFDKVKEWMSQENITGDIDSEDLMVGHSYFLADKESSLNTKMMYEVIPLLKEYINDGILNGNLKAEICQWEKDLDV